MPRHPLSRTSATNERSSSAEGSVGQSQPKMSRKNECAARIHFSQIEPKVFRCNICGVTIEQNKYSCSTVLCRHLKNEHRKEYNELRAQEVRSPSQSSVANYFERKVNMKQYYSGRTTKDTKEELVRFIFQSASPWNTVSKNTSYDCFDSSHRRRYSFHRLGPWRKKLLTFMRNWRPTFVND